MLEESKRLPLIRTLYRQRWLLSAYHYLLAFAGALLYGFPSRKLMVIGVTGTKGKTTTCNLIAHILGASGYKTGMATTVNFKIGDREWTNDTKQTMPGRFALQRLLRDMVRAGCHYAVIETSSEGIIQHRHRFINYRTAVFTNLSKEHIERHGSFENYRAAKLKLFERVARRKDGVGIYNLDDENVHYFLKPKISMQCGYTTHNSLPEGCFSLVKQLKIADIQLTAHGTSFGAEGERFEMSLPGAFNVYNAAAALCVAFSEDVPPGKAREALASMRPIPGRFEVIDNGQPFTVVVDYAHEPMSLESLYQTVQLFKPRRIVGLLGSQGGGRDTWKRAAMGRIAGEYCDAVVLANEDPYDENPSAIIDDVEKGVLESANRKTQSIYKVVDRREAIKKALALAGPGDAVVLTGKGGEVWMCVAGGKKVPWDEKRFVEEALEELRGVSE